MRIHVIMDTDGKRFMANPDRECNKHFRHCDLQHRHIFTDDELANYELMMAASGMEDMPQPTEEEKRQ